MIIHSVSKDYELASFNTPEFLYALLNEENAMFVVDEKVYTLYKKYFEKIDDDRLFLITATEENKIIDTALDICEKMTAIPAKRNACLISAGGGIVQDISGFAANIIYRGVRWIFVPTTLLASCDSCIGGKTSLNYKKYKNLLGTFYPPDKILLCSSFFKTLSEKDFKSGLGEVIKFNIMAGEKGLANIESNLSKLLERDPQTVAEFVKSSLEFKKRFIEADEFDKGERIKLNFAHTFGHAIEVVSDYEIPHGTAVAIGMIMADSLSVKRKLLDPDCAKKAENILFKIIDINNSLLNVPREKVIAAIKKDKKQTGENLTAVLMTNDLNDERLIVVHDVTQDEFITAYDYFLNLNEI